MAAVALLVAAGGIGVHQLVTRTGADSRAGASPESGKAPDAPVEGDFNGDGLGDVMFHQVLSISPEVTSHVVTMTSTPTGFAAPEATSLPGAPYHSELLGDVGGDGRPDRLDFTLQKSGTARASRTNKVAVRTGQGDSFTQSIAIPGRAWAVPYLGDLDADGRDDVVLVSSPSADVTEIWVAPSSADGFARPTSWLRARGLGQLDGTSLVPGDFDGNGDHDLAVRQGLTNGNVRLRFIESNGSSLAQPGPPRAVHGETYNRPDLIAGDFDGDGTDELLENLLTQGTFDASIHRLRGGRFSVQESWAATPARTETPGIRVTASDVDGDGDDDLARLEFQSSSSWTLDALVSNGSGFDAPSHETTYECTALCQDFRVGFVTRGG